MACIEVSDSWLVFKLTKAAAGGVSLESL
jgi:hypothetical protein